jgi:DNA-binding transcriptional regulator GbsR (MarR family)
MEYAAADPERRFAAAELAAELGEPLGNVSYHVRQLHADGLLQRAGQRTVRGARQRYYRAGAQLLA